MTTTPETVQHQSLPGALLAAQRDIQHVRKDAHNEHHKFDYASADGIVSDARSILHKHGLVARVKGCGVETIASETGTSREGSFEKPRALVRVEFELSHPDSSQAESVEHALIAIAERGRPIDKAILGVRTSLWAYYLRDLLMLPRFDDKQVCDRDDREYDPDAIGKESAAELVEQLNRVGMSVEFIRRKLVEGKVDADSVRGKPHTWPKALLPRIQAGIDHYTKKATDQAAAIKSLPQRPAPAAPAPTDHGRTYEPTHEPAATDDVPTFKPKASPRSTPAPPSPKPAAPATATGKPAARGTAGAGAGAASSRFRRTSPPPREPAVATKAGTQFVPIDQNDLIDL
jgi:hypothetical protein